MKSPYHSDTGPFDQPLKWMSIGLPVAMIAVIAVLAFVDWRFDAFEDTLRYQLPVKAKYNSGVSNLDELTFVPVQGQIVYVPAYSHIYHQDGGSLLLTITLSIRNTSMDRHIVVKSVRYFDTDGNEVKSYLDKPARLAPLATTEFLIERRDTTGGSGANFLVEWVAEEPVSEPIIEAVMIDTDGQQGISFARPGHVISETPQDSMQIPQQRN